jgi:type II restriction enzyme
MRKPLSPKARRAGWIGCNIRLDLIAPDARIEIVQGATQTDPRSVRKVFQRFNRLHRIAPRSRGWVTLTLQTIRSIGQSTFSLDELYARESFFAKIYPKNNNIRPKLRQQLQVLRDLGYIEFCGRGHYKLLF